jgi:peptidoglycan/LPS O-acetylase OafA/YrhL
MSFDLPQSSNNQHLPVLDGFRGLAAYTVVVSHATNATNLAGGLLGNGAGQVGVMLFFVLSGFLMGLLYLGTPFDRISVWRFAIRRVARVVPLYYIMLTIALIAAGVGGLIARDLTLYAVVPSDLIYHYSFIYGTSVFWTIPVELQFYLAFVGVWWLYGKSRILFLICVLSAIVWFFLGDTGPTVAPVLLDYFAYFLAGLLISQISKRFEPRPLWTIGFVAATCAALLLFPGIFGAIFRRPRWSNFPQMWHDPVCLVTVSALLLTSLFAPAARLLLANRLMIFSGRISYSMYLLHVPVIVCLSRYTTASQHPSVFLFLALAITFGIASASFRWIESPLREFVGRAAYFAGTKARAKEAPEHAMVS